MKKTAPQTISISSANSVLMTSAIAASLLLTSCGGEFAYKRGASARDLDQAKQQCQHSASETALGQCMEQNGWIYHNPQEALEDEDPVIQASFQHDYRSAGKVVNEDTPAPTSSAVAQTDSASTATPVAKPAEQRPAAKKPTDPMDIFLVSSWWKIGKGADSLKGDLAECVAKLGEAHAPDMTGKTVKATRGLLLCMKDLGWKALQARE